MFSELNESPFYRNLLAGEMPVIPIELTNKTLIRLFAYLFVTVTILIMLQFFLKTIK